MGGPYYGRLPRLPGASKNQRKSTPSIEHVVPKEWINKVNDIWNRKANKNRNNAQNANRDTASQSTVNTQDLKRSAECMIEYAKSISGDVFNCMVADRHANSTRQTKGLACFSLKTTNPHRQRDDEATLEKYFVEVPPARRGHVALIQTYMALTYEGVSHSTYKVEDKTFDELFGNRHDFLVELFADWLSSAAFYKPCRAEKQFVAKQRMVIKEHLVRFNSDWTWTGGTVSKEYYPNGWGNWLFECETPYKRYDFLMRPAVLRILARELFKVELTHGEINKMPGMARWYYKRGAHATPNPRELPSCWE
jgi:hypothetical protein